jgi:hypothetical protein
MSKFCCLIFKVGFLFLLFEIQSVYVSFFHNVFAKREFVCMFEAFVNL